MTTSLSEPPAPSAPSAPSFTERLVTKLASLGRPTSRRTFLTAATLTGAALAVNPWDYVTKPQDAYGSVCGPGAKCSAGWSAMCCSIHKGRNTCPPGTFAGGWWKADRSSFCGGAARYYIDCNAKPGEHFTCRCNKSNCDHRYVACNKFRYGQCNTKVKGVTPVVCRQISCTPPWKLYPGKCGRSSATDNNTRAHNAPCLSKDNTYPRTVTFKDGRHVLHDGQNLLVGRRLVARNRHTKLTMQKDGNLVLRNGRGIVWQTRTARKAKGGHLVVGQGGRLAVVDRRGRVRWRNNVAPRTGDTTLSITNGGQLVAKVGDTVVWRTKTKTP